MFARKPACWGSWFWGVSTCAAVLVMLQPGCTERLQSPVAKSRASISTCNELLHSCLLQNSNVVNALIPLSSNESIDFAEVARIALGKAGFAAYISTNPTAFQDGFGRPLVARVSTNFSGSPSWPWYVVVDVWSTGPDGVNNVMAGDDVF